MCRLRIYVVYFFLTRKGIYIKGLRGSGQSLWGGSEDILNFGGRVSLEDSSSSNSRAESSSEDHEGIITSLQWPQLHS